MANEKISKDSIVKALRKENNAVWDQIIENLRLIDKKGVGAPASSDKMKARMKKSEGLSARVKLLEAAIDKYKNGPKYPRKIPSNILKILGKTPPSKTKPLPKSKGGEMEAAAAAKAAAAKAAAAKAAAAKAAAPAPAEVKTDEGITKAVKAAEDVRGENLEKYGHLRPENEKTMEQKNWKGFKEEKDAYSEYDKYSGGGMVKTYARGGSPRKVRY